MPHCCWSTVAAPVNVEAAALVVEVGAAAVGVEVAVTLAGPALPVVGAEADEAGGGAAVPEGTVMVTPPDRQNCWANAMVAGWWGGRVSWGWVFFLTD